MTSVVRFTIKMAYSNLTPCRYDINREAIGYWLLSHPRGQRPVHQYPRHHFLSPSLSLRQRYPDRRPARYGFTKSSTTATG